MRTNSEPAFYLSKIIETGDKGWQIMTCGLKISISLWNNLFPGWSKWVSFGVWERKEGQHS